MKIRTPNYIATMAISALGLAVFLLAGFDPAVDAIGLSKGAGLGWAFAFVLANAVLVVGVVLDLIVLAWSHFDTMRKAHG